MKWRNHRFVTAAAVFAMSGHLLPTALAMYGSVFPDSIEGDDYGSLMWMQNHRGMSHLLSIYVGLLAALQLYYGKLIYFLNQNELTMMVKISLEQKDPGPAFLLAGYCATWFLIGCVFHLIEDMFCNGGIPIFEVNKKYGIDLFYTNTPRENIIAFVIIALCMGYRYFYVEPFSYGL